MLLAALLALAAGRDAWLWPFSADSIWNTSLGRSAVLTPAGLTPSKYIGVDHERFFRLKASDPIRKIYAPSSWGKRWPGDKSHVLGTLPVPDDLIIPDAIAGSTPNECTSFLLPDGRTLIQLEPTCRAESGGDIVGYPREAVDLYGPGTFGSHWGSGLSTLGGSIRLGELTGPSPIHHALKLNVWGDRLSYVGGKGFRWPADRNDAAASQTYHGQNPKLKMGSLLALSPKLTIKDIGLKTAVGKRLFQALQDYGVYVTDDSGWDAYDLVLRLAWRTKCVPKPDSHSLGAPATYLKTSIAW